MFSRRDVPPGRLSPHRISPPQSEKSTLFTACFFFAMSYKGPLRTFESSDPRAVPYPCWAARYIDRQNNDA